jgi:hypothetical protein
MELENFTLNKVSQAQKVKGSMFPLICGSYTYKLNVYRETYVIIYMCIYRKHIYSERENKIVLVSLREVWEVGELKKMLENEKY